jgi:hypothetical protein
LLLLQSQNPFLTFPCTSTITPNKTHTPTSKPNWGSKQSKNSPLPPNRGLMKSKNLLCIQPTLGKQVRFFERKPDFSESENRGSLNENQEYMESKTRGSLSENLIWWNYLPKN